MIYLGFGVYMFLILVIYKYLWMTILDLIIFMQIYFFLN